MDNLKKVSNWICWKYAKDEKGRLTKIPVNAKTGGNAMSNNKDSWTSYEVAQNASKRFDGIGIMFFNGLAGIDIDGHKEENKLAAEVLDLFKNTYTELSPSGSGYHIIFTVDETQIPVDSVGKWDSKYYKKNPHNELECYVGGFTNRFFTFTGKQVSANNDITDQTENLLIFLDKYMKKEQQPVNKSIVTPLSVSTIPINYTDILDNARQSKNGAKFSALYDYGDTSIYNDDDSSADLALCSMLAFWLYESGGESAIDEAFRHSKLYRQKWEREDYRTETIRKGIECCNGEFHKNINIQYNAEENSLNLNRFHLRNDSGKITGVFDLEIFNYICQTTHLFIMGGVPYIYENGAFTPDISGTKLKTKIRKLIYPNFVKSTTIKRIYELFLQSEELQTTFEEVNNYPPEWICFKNGFYNPLTREFIEHSPIYKAINQIPHSFNIQSEPQGKHIEEWFNFIFNEAAEREMILQFAGLCLNRDTRQQKFLVLNGEGGTGKSTLIRLIESATGNENISNISLCELTQRFSSYGLMGKLLNSCADLETTALEDVSILKKILGEDTLRAEQKGKDAIFFKSYAKLIFSTNELPQIRGERSNGFYRRLLVFTMNKTPENKSANFFEVLNNEIDYFIKLSVEALSRMYKGGLIAEPESSIEAVKQMREDSDSVEAFLNAKTEKKQEERTDRVALYSSYEMFCSENDRQALSRTNFFKALRSKGYCREEKSNGINYFKGITFKKQVLTF